MIPQDVIEEIRLRVNLVQIIGEVVPLKKRGKDHLGLCPFHDDHSPSLTVSEEKQLYHCFACGAGGNVFTFVKEFHRLPFPEVLEKLAERAGIDLRSHQKTTEESRRRASERKELLDVLQYACNLYHHGLKNSVHAKEIRKYAESRGLSPSVIDKNKIGYAPKIGDALAQAIERDGKDRAIAEKAGLLRRQGNLWKDVFWDRLLFPIRNEKGAVIGFGGRSVSDAMPKYLNSPQTPVFDKSRTLYGLFESVEGIRAKKEAIVVEGYMDRMALVTNGWNNVVAPLGTAFTASHANLLKKYTDRVLLLFDGDKAGIQAARRALHPLLCQGLEVRVAVLPNGEDPDSLVRGKGCDALEEVMFHAQEAFEFLAKNFYRNEPSLEKKASILEDIAGFVREAKTPFLKEALLSRASETFKVDSSVFKEKKNARSSWVASSASARNLAKDKADEKDTFNEEWTLLRLSAEYAEARNLLLEDGTLEYFTSDTFAAAVREWLLAIMQEEERKSPSALLDFWPQESTRPKLAEIFLRGVSFAENEWERVYRDCQKKLLKKEMKKITNEIALEDQKGNHEAVEDLMKKKEELRKMETRSIDSRL